MNGEIHAGDGPVKVASARTLYNPAFVVQLLLFIVLIVTLVVLAQNRSNSSAILEISKGNATRGSENQQILKEVLSCTTPDGACAKRGSAEQADTVAKIELIVIYAASCSNQATRPITAAEIRSCVEHELVLDAKTKTKGPKP